MRRSKSNLVSVVMVRMAGLAAAILTVAIGEVSAADTLPPQAVEIPVMRTSIYIGSVTLTVSTLERIADTLDYSADYQARVIPWLFWSETGRITLTPKETDIERLFEGETIEVDGSATNHRGKPRIVSAKIQPEDLDGGIIKVRIEAGGTKLVFDGRYRFENAP